MRCEVIAEGNCATESGGNGCKVRKVVAKRNLTRKSYCVREKEVIA